MSLGSSYVTVTPECEPAVNIAPTVSRCPSGFIPKNVESSLIALFFVWVADVSDITISSSFAISDAVIAFNSLIFLSVIYNPLFNLLCLFIDDVFNLVLFGLPIDVRF